MTQSRGAADRSGKWAVLFLVLAAGGCQDLGVPRGQRTIHDAKSGFTATFPGKERICRVPGWGRTIGLSMELDGARRACGAPTDVSFPHVSLVRSNDAEHADLERVVRATRPCMPEPAADLSGLEFAGRESFVCEETGTDGLPIIEVFTLTRGREIDGLGPRYAVYVASLSTTPERRASDLRLFRILLAGVVFDAGPAETETEFPPGAPAAPV